MVCKTASIFDDVLRVRRRPARARRRSTNEQKTSELPEDSAARSAVRSALSRKHWTRRRRVVRRLLCAGKPVSGADNKARRRPVGRPSTAGRPRMSVSQAGARSARSSLPPLLSFVVASLIGIPGHTSPGYSTAYNNEPPSYHRLVSKRLERLGQMPLLAAV